MQRIHFNFDFKKATQGLNHFALKEGGQINRMKAIKLVYFADRYHVRKYGRMITNDIYFAMNYGAVPSSAKDIAEASDYLGDSEREYSSQYIEAGENLILKSINQVDGGVFSESDIEALNFAWDNFGHLDQFQLAELTHKYPEWYKHKNALELDSRVQMNLEDFFDDPVSNVEKCFELSDQDRDTRREHLEEMFHIESMWS